MKILTICLFVSSLVLASCSCHWVQTGYHYDSDDNYVEEGYYDCPENNPVDNNNYKPIEEKYVILTTELISKNYNSSDKNYYQVTVNLKNLGNAAALNVKCNITVKRDNYFNIKPFTPIIQTYEMGDIAGGSTQGFNFSINDIPINGGPIYNATIIVTYTDSKGKSGSYENHFGI